MSPPRRRRRKRKKGGGRPAESGGKPQPEQQSREQAADGAPGGRRRSRRRRGRRRSGASPLPSSPKSSEDLVRAWWKERPTELTGKPDGQDLDEIIGDLQSEYGVPQYPQEYRLLIKVSEGKESTSESTDETVRVVSARQSSGGNGDGPKREKAPAAPLMRTRADGTPSRRNRRGGRRRRRGGGGGQGQSGNAPPDS
jgi:hypothetical protein